MGINWYEIANDDSLTPEDLFAFYAFMSSPEDFSNREALITIAEKMNRLKDAYIDVISGGMANELKEAANNPQYVLDVDYLSPEDRDALFDMNGEADGDSEGKTGDNVIKLHSYLRRDIENVAQKLSGNFFSEADINRAIDYFKKLPWAYEDWGYIWIDLAELLKKLVNLEVDVDLLRKGNVQEAVKQMLELGRVLDDINSIGRRTGALSHYMPNVGGDDNWFVWVLNLAKNASNPLGLAYLSNDYNMIRALTKNNMPYVFNYARVVRFVLDTLQNMSEDDARIFLENVGNAELIRIITDYFNDGKKLLHLLKNPNLYTSLDDRRLTSFMSRLIQLVGIDDFYSALQLSIHGIMHYLSPEVLAFLKRLDNYEINNLVKYVESRTGREGRV